MYKLALLNSRGRITEYFFLLLLVVTQAPTVALADECLSAPPSSELLTINSTENQSRVQLLNQNGTWHGCLQVHSCKWLVNDPTVHLHVVRSYMEPNACAWSQNSEGGWISSCPDSVSLAEWTKQFGNLSFMSRYCKTVDSAKLVTNFPEAHLVYSLKHPKECIEILQRVSDGAIGLLINKPCTQMEEALSILKAHLRTEAMQILSSSADASTYFSVQLTSVGSVSLGVSKGVDISYIESWIKSIQGLPKNYNFDIADDPFEQVPANTDFHRILHFLAAASLRLNFEAMNVAPNGDLLKDLYESSARWMSSVVFEENLNHREALFRVELATKGRN